MFKGFVYHLPFKNKKFAKKWLDQLRQNAHFIVYSHFIAVTYSYRFSIGEGNASVAILEAYSVLSQFLSLLDLSTLLKFFVCSDTRDPFVSPPRSKM